MSKQHDPYSSLKISAFRYFLAGKFLLTLAVQMQAVIASWMIYAFTKDPLSLGLIGLTEAIPALSLALPGGLLADRISRKKIMVVTAFLMFCGALVLVYYTHLDHPSFIWPLYAVIFMVGMARGFHTPAQAAYWAQILPREQYVNGSVWNSSLWQIGAVTGPALGGLCYAQIGPYYSSIIVASFILLVTLLYTALQPTSIPPKIEGESIAESLKTGLRFFFRQPILLSAVTLDLFAVLFGGAVALLPAFADQVLHTGPEGLGYLRSAPALGAVMMALVLAFRPPHKNAGRKMLICVAGFGICMIGFALSTSFLLSFVLLMLSGMFDNVSVVIRSTILQTFTPDEMRGRIAAVNSIFIGSSNELGAFESGVTARLLGLTNSVIFGGAMTLVVVTITNKLAPTLKKLDL
jgi:MFS family permease